MATVVSVGDSAVAIGVESPLDDGTTVATATTYRRGDGDDYDEFGSAGGDFIYDPSGALVGGTVTSWQHAEPGNQFLVTDISVPVSSFPFEISHPLYELLFSGDDSMSGSSQSDHLFGFDGKDTLVGLGGDDYLDGSLGADSMSGGLGNDIYQVDDLADFVDEAAGQGIDTVESFVSHILSAEVENLILKGELDAALSGTGNALNNSIAGDGGDNKLSGLAGNDTLDGGAGADTMIGGDGDDLFIQTDPDDEIKDIGGTNSLVTNQSLAAGVDFISNYQFTGGAPVNFKGTKSSNLVIGTNFNDTIDGGASADSLIGGDGDDLLIGGAHSDVLDGEGGKDTLDGGLGNDTYYLADADDVFMDKGGFDTVVVPVSVNLLTTKYAGIEIVALSGEDDLSISGNHGKNILVGNGGANLITGLGGNDWLTGNEGNDTINGNGGIDRMEGDLGNDLYYVDNFKDIVSEKFGGASDVDTVKSTISYSLGAGVENLVLIGSAPLNGTGNELDNVLSGNAASNRLDGGAGADVLAGDGGNDSYFVDNAGDKVEESDGSAKGGIDTVVSKLDYALGDNLENLILDAQGKAHAATGNALNNVLQGNAVDNTLDGGGGLDRMIGGAGNDLYHVDESGDTVLESIAGAKGGHDIVESEVTFTLLGFVEQLTLLGVADIDGTGNALANTLNGNDGVNRLRGGGGNDTLSGAGGGDTLNGGAGNDSMAGGVGDDTYIVDSVADKISDSDGYDTVHSTVSHHLGNDLENLELLGSAAINGAGNELANVITGNKANNVLSGDLGDDTLEGAAGNDRLFGGEGADSLNGGVGSDALIGGAGIDSIDVSLGNDRLFYTSVVDAGDIVTAFDGAVAGGQDQVNLDRLFDSLAVAAKDRAERVGVFDNGDSVDIRVDADGDTGNGYELLVVTLNTADTITVGADVILSG